MRPHVLLNFRICIPLFPVYFVAADVKKLIGEELSHLFDELVKKLVRALAGRIHGRIEDSPLAFDGIWSRPTREIGIPHKPRGAVAWHIKFRYNTNAAITGV